MLQIQFISSKTGGMFTRLGDIGFVFGFEVGEGGLEFFGVGFVKVDGVAGLGEGFGEFFVFGFEALDCGLGVGVLGTEFLEGDFEVPVFLFVFVYSGLKEMEGVNKTFFMECADITYLNYAPVALM